MSEGQDEDLEFLVHTVRLSFAPPSDKQALGLTRFSNRSQDLSIRCGIEGKTGFVGISVDCFARAHIPVFEFSMSRKQGNSSSKSNENFGTTLWHKINFF